MTDTLGPNRYIPPTFQYSRDNIAGGPATMNWNTMQSYYMPQQNNDTFSSGYMSNLQNLLSQFSTQYGGGGPNRQPTLPRFNQNQYSGGRSQMGYGGMPGAGTVGGNYRNQAQGMFNGMQNSQMFDPRMMDLFGRQGLGQLTPNGTSGYPTAPNPGDVPNGGNKPYRVPNGG